MMYTLSHTCYLSPSYMQVETAAQAYSPLLLLHAMKLTLGQGYMHYLKQPLTLEQHILQLQVTMDDLHNSSDAHIAASQMD